VQPDALVTDTSREELIVFIPMASMAAEKIASQQRGREPASGRVALGGV
jgi:hypothetical protein